MNELIQNPWVKHWKESAWEFIQNEVDMRAKSLTVINDYLDVPKGDGIMTYGNLCRLASPKFDTDFKNQSIYWVYAPLVVRFLEYACWVCLGIFDYKKHSAHRHWVYFVRKDRGTINHLKTYFSLFANEDFYKEFFQDNFILSHPFYEKLNNSIRTKEVRGERIHLDRGLPFYISLDQKMEAPIHWINPIDDSPYGLMFDFSHVWKTIIQNPDLERIQSMRRLEDTLSPVSENQLGLHRFLKKADSVSRVYSGYVRSLKSYTFSESERNKYFPDILHLKKDRTTGSTKKRLLVDKSHSLLNRLFSGNEGSQIADKFLSYLLFMSDATCQIEYNEDDIPRIKSSISSILTLPAWLPFGEMGQTGKAVSMIVCFENNVHEIVRDYTNYMTSTFSAGSLMFTLEKAKKVGEKDESNSQFRMQAHEMKKVVGIIRKKNPEFTLNLVRAYLNTLFAVNWEKEHFLSGFGFDFSTDRFTKLVMMAMELSAKIEILIEWGDTESASIVDKTENDLAVKVNKILERFQFESGEYTICLTEIEKKQVFSALVCCIRNVLQHSAEDSRVWIYIDHDKDVSDQPIVLMNNDRNSIEFNFETMDWVPTKKYHPGKSEEALMYYVNEWGGSKSKIFMGIDPDSPTKFLTKFPLPLNFLEISSD